MMGVVMTSYAEMARRAPTYQGSTLPGIVFMVNPVALSLPEVGVLALHLLNHHDGEVVCRVARGVEVGCYWFL